MPENTAIEAVETEKQWRTRAQVAQHLQISARTIGHWMQRGILPFSKTGHLVRFELNHCDRVVERFRVESRPRPAKDSAGHTRRWRTKQQVATHLNISLRTVTSIMRRRIVPYLKIGGAGRCFERRTHRRHSQFVRAKGGYPLTWSAKSDTHGRICAVTCSAGQSGPQNKNEVGRNPSASNSTSQPRFPSLCPKIESSSARNAGGVL